MSGQPTVLTPLLLNIQDSSQSANSSTFHSTSNGDETLPKSYSASSVDAPLHKSDSTSSVASSLSTSSSTSSVTSSSTTLHRRKNIFSHYQPPVPSAATTNHTSSRSGSVSHHSHFVSSALRQKLNNFVPDIIRKNWDHSYADDVYYFCLNQSWTTFWISCVIAYTCVALVFAALSIPFQNDISPTCSFAQLFLLSFNNISGVGFNSVAYSSSHTYILFLWSMQALFKILSFSLLTGLIYSRFARPTSRIRFSQCALICAHRKKNTLMFRVTNQRPNGMLSSKVELTFSLSEPLLDVHGNPEMDANGKPATWRGFQDLPLARDSLPLFSLPWTVMHTVDEQSPIYHKHLDELISGSAQLIVTISAFDPVINGTIFARHVYTARDIRIGYSFVDMFSSDQLTGERSVDMKLMDDIKPAAIMLDPEEEAEQKQQTQRG